MVESSPQLYQSMPRSDAIREASEDLRRHRRSQRRAAFLEELRGRYHYRVFLDRPRLKQPIAGGLTVGRASAQVSIVEFLDFQCPFCSGMSAVLDRILREYPDDVRLTFKNFPLSIHPQAAPAAEAALCAGEQNRFWEMYKLIFAQRDLVSAGRFGELAARAGLDVAAFKTCAESGRQEKAWQSDKSEGSAIGVFSTPTVFINGRMISGARSYEAIKKIVDEEIRDGTDRAAAKIQ